MNDHHLDDLIIDELEPTSQKSKTFLSIIALAIVILIVGLILWALLFDSSEPTPTDSNSQNQSQSLDPALTPLEPLDHAKASTPANPFKAPQVARPKPTPKPASMPNPHPKNPPAPVQKPTPAPKPAAPAPQVTPPVTHAPPPKGHLIKTADKPIYYIQVGAFKRDPSPRFMKKLKENGFTFITKSSRGVRRVRVGPYDSYEEAKAALPVVKQKLNVDGLIVKF